jgi:hypothetical protein
MVSLFIFKCIFSVFKLIYALKYYRYRTLLLAGVLLVAVALIIDSAEGKKQKNEKLRESYKTDGKQKEGKQW